MRGGKVKLNKKKQIKIETKCDTQITWHFWILAPIYHLLVPYAYKNTLLRNKLLKYDSSTVYQIECDYEREANISI